MLIVISGLPATGKTTLAEALARHVGGVHLSVDNVEDALLRCGLEHGWTSGVAAYEAVGAAAQQNLTLGLTVIVDAVNDSESARQVWPDEPLEVSTTDSVEQLVHRLQRELRLSRSGLAP